MQCVEYTVQHFGPTDGAFASVFCAWTAFYLIAALATMYWLETQVATELRARRSPAEDDGDISDPDRLIAPGLDAAVVLLGVPGRDRSRDVHNALPPLVLAGATAAPGFWDWSFDPPLVLVIDLAILYWLGDRRTVTPRRTRAAKHWRSACFYTGLLVLAIALASPIEILSEQLFWVHMVQHVLLLVVAAPLIVLARPWIRLWRCLPLDARRSLARELSHGGRAAPLARAARAVGSPLPSFLLFSVVLLAWHVPLFFDATLRSSALHALEHTLFFATALMFWKQVIASPPLRASLDASQRVLYVVGAMVVSWVLAVVLALAPHPLYGFYAHLASRPGGISAMADQQIAAGTMWVPGSVTFVIVIFVYVHRWLMPPAPAPAPGARLAGEH